MAVGLQEPTIHHTGKGEVANDGIPFVEKP